jgi:hypothetical protein
MQCYSSKESSSRYSKAIVIRLRFLALNELCNRKDLIQELVEQLGRDSELTDKMAEEE